MNGFVRWCVELVPNNGAAVKQVFSSLRYREYRLYFVGQCFSLTGTWIQQIALSWLIYRITDSVFLLAAVGFLSQIPSLIISPFAGAVSDRYDRKRLLIITQLLSMLQALLLSILTLGGWIEVWQILVLSLFLGIVNSFDTTIRQVFYSALVPKSDLSNAVSLNSATINAAKLVGPAIGGVMIGWFGEGWCFTINTVSFLFVLLAVMKINYPNQTFSRSGFMDELRAGFSYMISHRSIRTIIIMTSLMSFIAIPFLNLVPAYVKIQLGGDSSDLGLFMSMVGAGSLLSALYLAARKSPLGLGKLIMLSLYGYSFTLIGLGFVEGRGFAFILAFMLGFFNLSVVASANALLQTISVSTMTGRVISYYSMALLGMCPLGCLLQGYLERWISIPIVLYLSAFGTLLTGVYFTMNRIFIRKQTVEALERH